MDETSWNPWVRAILYFIGLGYCFLGVAVVMDIFMSSIESIISRRKKMYLMRPDLHARLDFKVWDEVVANLTLLCVGTSAPEILLSLIEVVGHNFDVGFLGPGSIVGSAAVNLLIIAFCNIALREGDTRIVKRYEVFCLTGVFSVFSFFWIYVILELSSAGVVELWEAILTLVYYPTLVIGAYYFNKRVTLKPRMPITFRGDEGAKEIAEATFFKGGVLDKESLLCFLRELRNYSGITVQEAAILAAAKLVESEPHSLLWYRMGGVRTLSSGRPLTQRLDARLEESSFVNFVLNKSFPTIPAVPQDSITYICHLRPGCAPNNCLITTFNLAEVLKIMKEDKIQVPSMLIVRVPTPDQTTALVEFESATVAVTETVGTFPVHITRSGGMDSEVSVRVQSMDGMAKHGEDYHPINDIVTFAPKQTSAEVEITIINERKYEPTEEFYLRLLLAHPEERVPYVKIGTLSIMEIKIIHDESPGVVQFEKRATIIEESAQVVTLYLERFDGSDGEVSVMWRTIDGSAIAGVDYEGGEGIVKFKHSEVRRFVMIPIVNTMTIEKDVRFDVELFDPTNGAVLGDITKATVIITDDNSIFDYIENVMTLTALKLEQLSGERAHWQRQIREAMMVNGGSKVVPTNTDYTLHFLNFFWKVLFALIPPPGLLGGWLQFFTSMILIGVMATLIGDMASIFGCVVGMEDSVTALVLVGIGTSLPDVFACWIAMKHSKTADEAIGNINGTCSVNIFLGLGFPWTLAAISHAIKGDIMRVPSKGFSLALLLFSICNLITFVILIVRRNCKMCGYAEVGGPSAGRYITAAVMVLLYVVYCIISSLNIQGYISL